MSLLTRSENTVGNRFRCPRAFVPSRIPRYRRGDWANEERAPAGERSTQRSVSSYDRNESGRERYLAFSDDDISMLISFDDFDTNVAFDLIEELPTRSFIYVSSTSNYLFAFFQMVVLAYVGPTDKHDCQLIVAPVKKETIRSPSLSKTQNLADINLLQTGGTKSAWLSAIQRLTLTTLTGELGIMTCVAVMRIQSTQC